MRTTPTPTPPPLLAPPSIQAARSPPSQRQKKSHRRRIRPTQGDWVLIREMDPNRLGTAQQVSEHALNADPGSDTDSDSKDDTTPNKLNAAATPPTLSVAAATSSNLQSLRTDEDAKERPMRTASVFGFDFQQSGDFSLDPVLMQNEKRSESDQGYGTTKDNKRKTQEEPKREDQITLDYDTTSTLETRMDYTSSGDKSHLNHLEGFTDNKDTRIIATEEDVATYQYSGSSLRDFTDPEFFQIARDSVLNASIVKKKLNAYGPPSIHAQRILDSLSDLVSSGDLLPEQFREVSDKEVGQTYVNSHAKTIDSDGHLEADDNDSSRDSGYETASVHAALDLPGVREEMLDILINDGCLERTGIHALQHLETNLFVHTFQRMLRKFAQELRVEAGKKEYRGAAYIFWYYAAYAAKGVCEYWGGTDKSVMTEMLAQLPEKKIELDHALQQAIRRPGSAADDEHDGIIDDWADEDTQDLALVHVKRLEKFIIGSVAFQDLREDLQEWVNTRTPAMLRATSNYELIPLMHTLQDLWKKAMERVVDTEMSWWPLAEPEKELRPNYTRVYSQPGIAPRGTPGCFYDDIPTSLAEKLFHGLDNTCDSTPKWAWNMYWKASMSKAVLLRGTTLMRVLREASEQRRRPISNVESIRQVTKRAGAPSKFGAHDGRKAGPHIVRAGNKATATSSKSRGKQPMISNTIQGKATIPTSGKSVAMSSKRDDEQGHDGGAQPQDTNVKKRPSVESRPVLFLSLDILTNDSMACSVDVGVRDLDTIENLRTSYKALRSSYFWNRKRPTGVKFYRFKSFIYKGKRRHHIHIHRDKERYPAKDDQNYEWKLEDEDGDVYPNGAAWYFFNHPEDCGTSTDLKAMLPKRTKDEVKSGTTVYGMYIEQRHSVWQIFVPVILVLGLALGGTIWFIPLWLKENPGDLQNATVPVLLAFTVVQFVLTLLTSLIIFRWSL